MTGDRIIDEIAKQGMLKDAVPNQEGGFIFVWAANAQEQLEALLEEDQQRFRDLLRRWQELADGGMEDYLPDRMRRALRHTYAETQQLLLR